MNNKHENFNQDNGMSTKDFVVGAIVGGLVGAATALFLAPKSGKELRDDLSAQGSMLMEKSAPLMEKGSALKQTATEKGMALKQTAQEKGTEWISVAKEKGAPITEAVKKRLSSSSDEELDSQSTDTVENQTVESNVVVDSPDDVYVGEETVDSKNTAKEETYASEKTGFNSTASGNTSREETPSDLSNNTVKVKSGTNKTGNKGNSSSK